MSDRVPRISIGLPVYNGERYLGDALESLLAQTLGDFELVVCDNASTDGTEELCRVYAGRDSRVRYLRRSSNVGAAANFNGCVELARGELFKWAAHDDLCAPAFLERCLERLEAGPSWVLAYPRTRVISPDGYEIDEIAGNPDTADPRPSVRYRALLRGHKCFEVFGVMRTQTLRETRGIGGHAHGDGVLLAQLALRGRFAEVREPLFLARRHDRQSMALLGDPARYSAWFDPALSGRRVFPHWRIQLEFLRSLATAPLAPGERARCLAAWGAEALRRRGALRGDLTAALRGVARGVGLELRSRRWSREATLAAIRERVGEPPAILDRPGEAYGDPWLEVRFASDEDAARSQLEMERLSDRSGWYIRCAADRERTPEAEDPSGRARLAHQDPAQRTRHVD